MGVTLPKPLMTKVEERDGNPLFRVGSSCVNGYRENMEDAHIVYLKDSWGFFGVFDGHVNEHCSAYLETAWKAALDENPGPWSDERMKELALSIDKEWLAKEAEGGSTGTFFLAHRDGNTMKLQVGNVGDSRVLLCKNGECVAMTDDHKPANPDERDRIMRCGGRVENNRVDGSLAVSRAFGDRDYKRNAGAGQLDQKVIALADVTHDEVPVNSDTSFAALCCDGVFESNFSNEEVIEFIKSKLPTTPDLAVLSGLVCEEAISRGSRDNISCMIVQFRDGADLAAMPHVKLVPGPFNASKSSAFLKMYKEMASRGAMTVEAALELRYDTMKKLPEEEVDDEERNAFGPGPGEELSGEERTKWFLTRYESFSKEGGNDRSEQFARIQMLQQQMGLPLPVLLALMNGGMGENDGQ